MAPTGLSDLSQQSPSPGSPEQALLQLQQQFLQARQEQMQQQQQLQQLMAANQRLQERLVATETKTSEPLHAVVSSALAKTIAPAKPDTFNGTASRRTPADVWLFGLETFFTATQIQHPEQRISFAAAQLRDSAATWWRKMLHDKVEINTWQQFKDAFVKQFIPVASKDTARSTLHEMKQDRRSIVSYCDAFTQSLLQLESGDMSAEDQLFLFKRGLNKDIAAHLAIMRPKTLEEAMSLAQQVEIETRNNARMNDHHSGMNRQRQFPFRPFRNGNGNGNHGSSSSPMELSQVGIQDQDNYDNRSDDNGSNDREEGTVNAMSSHPPRSGRRLSPEQVKEFMRRGVCFTCEKASHVSRFCPNRNSNKPQAQQKNA
jgi:hypothetical protein